ncbi:thiamine pyrophosphate-binding protein [Pseudorhodoplanes sp.]|uniref:thiamine pyrophosphate-binding protein n=1 Tax=Pseudorhodoplanes sp. TaxID=1934341 RepID=UPI00391BCCFC
MDQSQTVAGRIGKMLADLGARRCFGVIGTANFKVTHALIESGVGYVAARHEGNAAVMADAYAKSTGELTLLSVHSGPGLTNALTGIAEAAKSGTPLLVLAGDAPVGGVTSNFYFDQAGMARSVGAVAERIHSSRTALNDTMRAVTRVMRDRQTVVLSLPIDMQEELLIGNVAAPYVTPLVARIVPSEKAIETLVDDILRAKRPVILAGRGAVISGAEEQLTQLGEETGALMATTVCANGFFNGNPWSVGICGGFSTQSAAALLAEGDLFLGFGATFTQWTTKFGKLIGPQAVVAQIDIDAGRLGMQRQVHHGVQGDAALTADAIIKALKLRQSGSAKWRSDALRAQVTASLPQNEAYDDESTDTFIDPRTVSIAVDRILPDDRLVACDAGHFMGWVPRYLRVPDARASCMSFSFQSVGLGIGSAIGLAASRPERLTVLGTGDGGFFMSLADFETAVRLRLNMCILVYDDEAFGAEVHRFRRENLKVDMVQFAGTNIAEIARGFGARAIEVRKVSDLAPLEDWVRDGAQGVFVVDAKICPDLEADYHKEM